MPMDKLFVDIETFSSYPITEVGSYRYAQAPDFDILLLSHTDNGGEVQQIDLAAGAPEDTDREMEQFKTVLFNPGIIKRARNAAFEWWCLSEYFHLSWRDRAAWISEWEDTMLQCLYCGLPGGLDAAGRALEVPDDKAKLKSGRSLITYFCVPCKPTRSNGGRSRNLPRHDPEKWDLFKEYNQQDVRADCAQMEQLASWPVPAGLMQEWREDILMNARGIGIDRQLVAGAIACADEEDRLLKAEAARITQLDNPNSNQQLREWLAEQGVQLLNLSKSTVVCACTSGNLPEQAQRMLEIRAKTNKSSLSKYQTAQDATGDDGRIRGCLQFYGANRTGRWAGRLLQVQNLPRTHLDGQDDIRKIIKLRDTGSLRVLYGDVKDTLSQMIRTILIPRGINAWFIDADFSAIEARLIAWEAGEDWVLDEFRGAGKIYEATASRIFGIPKDTIIKGNPNYAYRQRGKVATLALGYQGGVGAMKRMGGDQLGLDDSGLQDIVDRWRAGSPNICKLWRKMQDAAIATLETGRMSVVKRKSDDGTRAVCIFRLETSSKMPYSFLTMQLPSGRRLFYAKPEATSDGRITYWEQTNAGWTQSETYGGKLTENMTQAIGRDCLAHALQGLRAAGYSVVFSVHDEAIIEIETADPAAELQKIITIMHQPPNWAPDLPLNADGWYGKFYTKD